MKRNIDYSKYKFNDILLVKWWDTEDDSGWQDNIKAASKPDDVLVDQLGFFTRYDGENLYISSSKLKSMRSKTTIPVKSIESIRKLK